MPVTPQDLIAVAHRLILIAVCEPLYALTREELLALALEFDRAAHELEQRAKQTTH